VSLRTGPDPLHAERTAALAQIEALTREFDEVVAASRSSNADDEHDPEGATIAFERQQVAALLESARRRLADVDAALARRETGDYGRCESCGRPIAAERLAARPAARTCIDCAR
jgi:RNA polymerase-binding protein DksA